MNRALLFAAGLVVMLVLLMGTANQSMAYDPGVSYIDWSGDEVNADANPLATGEAPLYATSLATEIDWSGDEVNADANPLATAV
jgi:hypothetical protein